MKMIPFVLFINSAMKQIRVVKFVYVIKHKKIRRLVIEYNIFREKDYKKKNTTRY